MTVEEMCRLLLTGHVDAADVPDLADEDVREEVRKRLAAVGCDLAYSGATGRWLARLDGALPAVDGHDPALSFHAAEQAMIAALWLHLRFLPLERAKLDLDDAEERLVADDEGEPSVEVDDLLAQFHGKLAKSYLEGMVLGHLKNAGFVRQHAGRLYAGPLLDTIDEVAASERARLLLARHKRLSYLQRRAAVITAEEDGDADLTRVTDAAGGTAGRGSTVDAEGGA